MSGVFAAAAATASAGVLTLSPASRLDEPRRSACQARRLEAARPTARQAVACSDGVSGAVDAVAQPRVALECRRFRLARRTVEQASKHVHLARGLPQQS